MFTRNPNNPLILSKSLPYQANAVFDAGAADLGDEVVLLLRVESSSGLSHLIVARSKDGVRNWQAEDRALLHPEEGPASPSSPDSAAEVAETPASSYRSHDNDQAAGALTVSLPSP